MAENQLRMPLNIVSLYLQLSRNRVQHALLEWFEGAARDFPWRGVDRGRGDVLNDPYVVLVSEVMLQQTQSDRVAARLPEFLAQFPDVRRLASATHGELLRAWSGLGYNRRALNLQRAAQQVVLQYDGEFPNDLEQLVALPGVGEYTASAIACFAFGRDVPVVDVNVARVISRVFYKCHTVGTVMPDRVVRAAAEEMLPAGDAYRWHSALMDLGSTVCTRRNPSCGECPLRELCLSAYPPALTLFDAESTRRPEPAIRGTPRRIWRGRIVELLRGEQHAVLVADIFDRLLPDASAEEWMALLEAASHLHTEGLIVRTGAVYEGPLNEHDHISLPH